MSEEKNIPQEELPENDPLSTDENSEPTQHIEPVSNPQPEISNPKSEIENMEVHHHGHVHEKKKWKEYLFQFIMLFLAVFCGFLAEYQLEHKIEKDRENQFITSLVADLQDDVNALDSIMTIEHIGIRQLDTLMYFLNDPALAKQNGDQLYYVARIGPRSQPFANNSRTFDQLKNAGGFRLIRNADASNKVMGYYNQFSHIRLLEDNYNHEFDNFKRIAAKIFDPAILRRQENELGVILTSTDNPALQTYDVGMLKELGFHTLQMNGSRRSKIGLLESLKKTAANLKSYLQKEYHLENE